MYVLASRQPVTEIPYTNIHSCPRKVGFRTLFVACTPTSTLRFCVLRPPFPKCPCARSKPEGDPNQKYLAKSLCLAWLCWCWRHAACIPPGTDSACSGHPFPSVLPLCRKSCVFRGCVAYHLAKFLRPQATRSQLKRSASQRAHREHAPNDVDRKVPV